jgi:hypothetical protein
MLSDKVKSGEYVYVSPKNTVIAQDKSGALIRCYKNDCRFTTGEFIHTNRKTIKRKEETPETRLKKSLSHIGKSSGIKDKKMPPRSEEYRKKISKRFKGKKRSNEVCEKNSMCRKGKRPAYDKTGLKLGLCSLTDTRWGI